MNKILISFIVSGMFITAALVIVYKYGKVGCKVVKDVSSWPGYWHLFPGSVSTSFIEKHAPRRWYGIFFIPPSRIYRMAIVFFVAAVVSIMISFIELR